ncbi:biotin--[acetyl-CoA-carboxylase] ligase [Limnoglobus roseus]|uniref:Biotin--[acetyl-CoA-carboxylase] ligase n=1 Tax=Limnoglobus roseus TaxID=2598579 RepID=A0A5C1AJ26_9BACT|nr:biotin--[acetyl-CoA-carboxylase] ligase [Limnoglobus roseus]QEL16978.1 biotin--[acetyl-CoA-carboxylase] ligase [Limnoglobus roseus]
MSDSPEHWHFDTRIIGREVFVYDELPSTNDRAADADLPVGTVVVARHQTRGRGQYNRVWQSRTGVSLLASIRLLPPPELNRPVTLTAWAAVAVGEATRELTGRQAKIKWPNDLLIRGKKICGILIEQKTATIVGIGLNLNQTAEEFAAANLPDATSLGIVGDSDFDLRRACEVVVGKLDAEYTRLLAGERVPLEADWKWRIGLLGQHVVADLADGEAVAGRLIEMGFDGIELDLGDGAVRVLTPEFVRHLAAV